VMIMEAHRHGLKPTPDVLPDGVTMLTVFSEPWNLSHNGRLEERVVELAERASAKPVARARRPAGSVHFHCRCRHP
jgi:hypothetical protein